ncbi:flagellar basal-body MS-ring/collar protein FliF [Yersinia enterocolitica]|uniref:Flagellar M-ring protein n=1 Tax=Yersinia enterocolitica subsp. palearctica serotype O:3 (strain DSM 13030 / CIP 106945 / Y11) TaxID=930944 RepID=A0A0H3NP02_YERE1|nr:flagellar basal-body MS-ring/collar protein FliF [Yersinia enterocolitica]EHB21405.1 flagellar MS-ring protein [Yersinia enterocolitica subsp. palearctica PhRBD_Ye1]EKN3315130.1 flagellar M-ring protein FliF [Yersinia enterocolitica]EKN3318946.1 flagellar M-ring protein FliF [Yersinia enterocolitica]EKN3323043.1 flagellar M-ring protein FliF [Yersinia enterocolitica]EKN3334791.1 flagellar M-ring protein FliF [Yersinia enterocolitica]
MNASITGGENRENTFTTTLTRLRANPKIPLLIAAAAAVAILVALMLWAKSPDYRVLYSNLNDRDGGDIVTQLTQLNIPYRFADNGGALLIPADKVHETRLRLAQQGLPKGGAVGFELLDQEKFGISQFSEQVNYQRALEGELARTIGTLGPVLNVRVHLAMPKPSLFVREQKSPTASVTLALQPGRALDDGQINAIVYMVSSSVAGLPPANVTVVNQTGRLLTQSDSAGRDLNAAQLKFTNEVENRFQRRIETILAPMVGSGNVHAQVTAQVDFASREQTDEEYKPNQAANQGAVRSQQVSTSEQLGGTNVGGVPGALSNQPSATPVAPIEVPQATPAAGAGAAANAAKQTATSSNSRHDQTTNFEVDRTIRHTQQQAGMVQRLSVAVVVNYGSDKAGKPIALSKDQLAQVESLTREAMGFSTVRGDTLNVVNTPFNATDDASGSNLPFWQQPSFFDQLLNIGRYLLILLVAWILWRKLVRPLIAKKQEADKAAASVNNIVQAAQTTETAKQTKEELALRKKNQQRVSAEVQAQRIRELADKDPRIVALVIRQWMSNDQ